MAEFVPLVAPAPPARQDVAFVAAARALLIAENEREQDWRDRRGKTELWAFDAGRLRPVHVGLFEPAGGVRVVPFADLDPERVFDVDTPPEGQGERSFASKLGGFARYIQDDIEEGADEPLRLLAQLGPDLFADELGDAGKLYVFLTTTGDPRVLVALQGH